MKNLIKKILIEQINMGDGVDKLEKDNQGNVSDNAMRRLRVVLDLMKRYGNKWAGYLDAIRISSKEPSGYSGMKDILNNLLKIVGGSRDGRYGGNFEKAYWFATIFQINGGKDRNFKEGEIQLIEIPQYRMEARYAEDVVDYRTGWGTVIAVEDEDEAIERFENNFGGFLEDSESGDMDYGDVYDVEDVSVLEVESIKFDPRWVGL